MNSHLQSFRVTLTALSPVFIGSGEELTKKEFIFIPHTKQVVVPDFAALYAYLEQRGLLDAFEAFMTDTVNKDLREWLGKHKVTPEDYPSFTACALEAGDAFGATGNIVAFRRFVRDPYGKPYIPGSSLKGALRTAVLAKLLRADTAYAAKTARALEGHVDKGFWKDTAKQMEEYNLHTLRFAKPGRDPDRRDAVNSLMRGIQVSDSAPLDNTCLVLAGKEDLSTAGKVKPLNLCRESLKPGTRAVFSLTLDNSVLRGSGIDKAFLLAALGEFAAVQKKQYAKFALPGGTENAPCAGAEVFLGGGAGFLSKTLLYALAPEDKALRITAAWMHKSFNRHYHNKDVALGVSPSKLKLTKFAGRYYPFGRCEVSFE